MLSHLWPLIFCLSTVCIVIIGCRDSATLWISFSNMGTGSSSTYHAWQIKGFQECLWHERMPMIWLLNLLGPLWDLESQCQPQVLSLHSRVLLPNFVLAASIDGCVSHPGTGPHTPTCIPITSSVQVWRIDIMTISHCLHSPKRKLEFNQVM